jgi:ribonuclease HII
MRPGPFAGIDPATLPTVIGCDEVGVGAWCGPVVAAAVWFDPAALPPDLLAALDDSKRLPAPTRARLAATLWDHAEIAIAARSARVIDRDGIRAATHAALLAAVHRLGRAGRVVIDGNAVPAALADRAAALVRAERAVPQVAAASIVAKVVRDDALTRLAARYPAFGWGSNVGYGTAVHRAELALRGPCPHHRFSYAPVRRAAEGAAAPRA